MNYSRRDWGRRAVQWSAGAACIALPGCPSFSASDEETGATRSEPDARASNVPLRVVWVGRDQDVAVLKRIWSSVSDQPIDVRRIESPRSNPEAMAGFWESASTSDVAVFPMLALPEWVDRDHWMPLQPAKGSEQTQTVDSGFGDALPRRVPPMFQVATQYAGETRAEMLGGYLPAMLVGEGGGDATWANWNECEAFFLEHGPQTGVPLAPGYAAATFLAMAASSVRGDWLFESRSLHPVLSTPEYTNVMKRLIRLADSNEECLNATPGKVWANVASGQWLAGLGYPQSRPADQSLDAFVSVRVTDLPSLSDSGPRPLDINSQRSLLEPFSLMASLSASCRQTAASATFLRWLTGGDGVAPLHRSIDQMIAPSRQSAFASDDTRDIETSYFEWWRGKLEQTSVVTSAPLTNAMSYYAALDESVLDAVRGSRSATDACEDVTKTWIRLHQEVGLPQQIRLWQRAGV
ncbi:MAG: hypothetical protein AAGC97_17355 [Planctomycetota bacterium]